MKTILISVIFLFINVTLAFTQTKTPTFSYDFLKYKTEAYCFNASNSGEIYFRCYYKSLDNKFGHANVSMIYKNGGDWWQKRSLEKYPKNPRISHYEAAEALCKKDSVLLKDFNMYAFYIDKKYLKREFAGCGESSDPKVKIDTSDCYGYAVTYPYEKILYFRAAGSKEWVEIERKRYKTDKDETVQTGYWETNFIRQKLEESNRK